MEFTWLRCFEPAAILAGTFPIVSRWLRPSIKAFKFAHKEHGSILIEIISQSQTGQSACIAEIPHMAFAMGIDASLPLNMRRKKGLNIFQEGLITTKNGRGLNLDRSITVKEASYPMALKCRGDMWQRAEKVRALWDNAQFSEPSSQVLIGHSDTGRRIVLAMQMYYSMLDRCASLYKFTQESQMCAVSILQDYAKTAFANIAVCKQKSEPIGFSFSINNIKHMGIQRIESIAFRRFALCDTLTAQTRCQSVVISLQLSGHRAEAFASKVTLGDDNFLGIRESTCRHPNSPSVYNGGIIPDCVEDY